MKHTTTPQLRHQDDGGNRASRNAEILLADPRHPDFAFIQRELDRDRRRERLLIPITFVALLVVGALVVVRQLFFV